MATKVKLKWEETKPGRIEAGNFAIISLTSTDYKFVLYNDGRVVDFYKDKTTAKKKAEKLSKDLD